MNRINDVSVEEINQEKVSCLSDDEFKKLTEQVENKSINKSEVKSKN